MTLPTPDAVIVRCVDGETIVVADISIPEQRVAELVDEAQHLEGDGVALG